MFNITIEEFEELIKNRYGCANVPKDLIFSGEMERTQLIFETCEEIAYIPNVDNEIFLTKTETGELWKKALAFQIYHTHLFWKAWSNRLENLNDGSLQISVDGYSKSFKNYPSLLHAQSELRGLYFDLAPDTIAILKKLKVYGNNI